MIIEKVLVPNGGDFCGLCDEFITEDTVALMHIESRKYLCLDCLIRIAEIPAPLLTT